MSLLYLKAVSYKPVPLNHNSSVLEKAHCQASWNKISKITLVSGSNTPADRYFRLQVTWEAAEERMYL
jgi:hypothetical protein